MFHTHYRVRPAKLPPGTYRNITGNEATALGFLAASKLADRPLFYGSYPITPASDILHQLSGYKTFGVKTFQAEDEIAAIGAAIGASYGGALGLTASSGPGIALKSEAMGLAVMVELPLVVIDVQRAGPSTGMPTKNEQADLLQVMFGRNSDSPLPIVAPATPGECFDYAIEACAARAEVHDAGRLPVRRVPRDGLRAVADPVARRTCRRSPSPTRSRATARSSRTCATRRRSPDHGPCRARPVWSIGSAASRRPTSPGNVSYDPDNHHRMQTLRAAKVAGIAEGHPAARGVRAAERRSADPRLGVDVRRDPVGRRAPAGRGPARSRTPISATSTRSPSQHRGRRPELSQGAHPGGQPRPAADAHPRPVPRRCRSATTACAASRSASPRSSTKRNGSSRDAHDHRTPTDDSTPHAERRPAGTQPGERPGHRADPEGLRVRPGGPLVPGLRRLLDPRPDPEGDARLRLQEGGHRLHLGHRLLGPAAVLHEHVRLPHDPRPRPDAGDRAEGRPPRPDGVGHHRRRRRAVDRWQPRHPFDAPQRRHQPGHVQQPHLRADQGPGVADVGVRQADEVDAGRDRSTRRSCR